MNAPAELRGIVREHYARIFASLYGRFRDIDVVEDALQDAFERAMRTWDDHRPHDPAAWLFTVARNRILDVKKKDGRTVGEVPERGEPSREIEALEEGRTLDEQLRLMCLCCHPALAERGQVMLTLKLVAGLSTEEIASALVMKPKTVGQTLTRSKTKIKLAGIPFDVPDESSLGERLGAVQKILYLLFNEGYHSNSDHSLYRIDLCKEAIRLTRILVDLRLDNRESVALLCLMLYQHSRSASRSTTDGRPILLAGQDRTLWNRAMIAEADSLYDRTISGANSDIVGLYTLQAAIAREHAHSPTFEASDWPRICRIYAELYLHKPDPIVLLAWLVAESYRSSPRQALGLMGLHRLEEHLSEYRWFYSTRGELRLRSNDAAGAHGDFRRALSLTRNPGERRFLEERLRITGGTV